MATQYKIFRDIFINKMVCSEYSMKKRRPDSKLGDNLPENARKKEVLNGFIFHTTLLAKSLQRETNRATYHTTRCFILLQKLSEVILFKN